MRRRAPYERPGQRVKGAAVAIGLTGLLVFGAIAPPEHCPTVTADDLRAAAADTVGWFVRNQDDDGRWLYEYSESEGPTGGAYNEVRHSGVTMGLYQAATAGIDGALDSADRGLVWALGRRVDRHGWTAIASGSQVSVGTTALLAAGLVERRESTGDERYDDELQRMGKFLVSQTEPSGAVLAYYNVRQDRPVAGQYSQYYTGEAFWALARLARVFPDEPSFAYAARRISMYLATERDDAEGHWPPIPDHWAAYGLAELTAAGVELSDDEVAYAASQAESFGVQVRWVSQRRGPWGLLVRGPHVPRGGGYGVVGEALTGLWLVARADARLASLETPIAERATCIAGNGIEAQTSSSESDDPRVAGAWFRDGTTRMDDQQHALAALLRTVPIVESPAASESSSGAERPSPSPLLWLVVVVAAVNPARAAVGVPRQASWRSTGRVAAIGGAAGSIVAIVLALVSGPLCDLLSVSPSALRIAAGVVAAIAGLADMVRRPPAPSPALVGGGAALVPVAVPLFVRPAVVVAALSAGTDAGIWFVAAAAVLAAATLTDLAAVRHKRGYPERPGRALRIVIGLVGAVLVAGGVLLVIDGAYDV